MKNKFAKVRVSQLYALCNIIAEARVRDLKNIRRRYLENALAFDETLSILEDLDIVKNRNGELAGTKELTNNINSKEEFNRKLLAILFSTGGEVSELLREYLLNFKINLDNIVFKATESEKIKYSDIRNLLLELEFITVNSDGTTYFVRSDCKDLFVDYFGRQKFSLDSLRRKQIDNELIGLTAEKAIIKFELKRLTNIYFDPCEIEHISQENAAAGYDIKSFENYLDDNSKRVRRYIEVKAVTVQDFKFYWSRVELEVAMVYGHRYYLYLLPVISNNNFDFDKLLIIDNPAENIYSDNQDWKRQVESISFSRKVEK